MDADLVAMFFALLLLGGGIGLAIALARPMSRRAIADAALPLAALVSVGATAGSLYFSEVAGFAPCELCWFQRIAMYPLAVIVPMAMVRNDRDALVYVQVLATIGLVVGLYHSQLQAFPDQGTFCELANPCTASPVKALRWVTIPHMSVLSFAAIATLATIGRRHTLAKEGEHNE